MADEFENSVLVRRRAIADIAEKSDRSEAEEAILNIAEEELKWRMLKSVLSGPITDMVDALRAKRIRECARSATRATDASLSCGITCSQGSTGRFDESPERLYSDLRHRHASACENLIHCLWVNVTSSPGPGSNQRYLPRILVGPITPS